ncbi:hypothetical protein FRC05_000586 [Tulasnella sp. 425]|nr:hypothetical protein FRC05_000586 [Tulasnella sp. 425]
MIRPSAASTPSSFPNSIFSTADLARLTLPRSTATTPATIYSNSPAPSTPNSPPLANDIAAVTNRIDDLEFAVALTEEREAEKAARKLAEDRLAEEIASHARTEELLLNERERHRKAESARTKACYALEKENADLEADLLDLTARSDLLHVQALQKALVQLHIVDANDRQYRLKYPACADCMGPFLKAVCTAAKQATQTNSKGGPEHELETAAPETFQAPSDESSCSESVSDKHARAPAPTEWFKSGSTRTRRPA